jgi:hypothetical protein
MDDNVVRATAEAASQLNSEEFARLPQARPMPVFEGKVTRRGTSPAFPTPKTAEVTQQDTTSSTPSYPFKILTSKNDSGDAQFTVYPGLIEGVGATLDGIPLSTDPDSQPHRTVLADNYSIYLMVGVTTDTTAGGTFRTTVDYVLVVTDDDGGLIDTDLAGLSPFELTVSWDDPTVKETGHFYIRVADLSAEVNDDTGFVTVTSLTQALRDNVVALVIAADEVVPITLS